MKNKEARGETIRIEFEQGCRYLLYTLGATLLEWTHPDGTDLVVRYRDLEKVGSGGQYLGALIGPTAGRIEDSRFTLNGTQYRLNEGSKHFLHGGTCGWHNVVFDLHSIVSETDSITVVMKTRQSHSILPGTVDLTVTQTFFADGYRLSFDAWTDKPTLLNVTTHGYYSLLGTFTNDLIDHVLELDASHVIEVDDEIIGRTILAVEGTAFDFQKPRPLIQAIHDPGLLSQGAKGLDHCYLLDHKKPFSLRLTSPKTKKVLTVKTTYPGLTLYSTNYPKPDVIQNGSTLKLNGALAIEPQFPSNGINDARFPDLILRPGQPYHHEIAMTIQEEPQ
jgi:aldose 1-epimerase